MSLSNPRRRNLAPRADAATGTGLSLKTSLRKGATFHSPTSPVESFAPPTLQRSDTSHDDVVDARRRRMAMLVDDFDKIIKREDSPSPEPTARPFCDNSAPLPFGFVNQPVVDPAKAKAKKAEMERRVLRPRQRHSSRHHESDSGLGTSLASSTMEKRTSGPALKKDKKLSAISRSAASSSKERVPGLSPKAAARFHEHILRPLRAKSSLKDFEPIVLDVPRRIREREIVCLRDLEKTLVLMAPERTKTAELYLDFCLTSIRCVQATVEYLTDREQTRPNDRPYTNGYFIDLVEQIRQYAGQLASVKDAGSAEGEMTFDHTDEVKLFGGISENGRPAELVRVGKDGKAISMATGLPVDLDEDSSSHIKMKRSLSQQLEDEEEIMRSMARRKKNASPEELAPKKCSEPGCDREFKRPCDLTKHAKTHSRPWKCPVKTCKYHEYGWPTPKELDRHHNDKHSSAPPMYECEFKPCPYKSKRQSNCKQHMEKAHNWTYHRTKNNGKKPASKAGSSAQPTPQLGNMPTPSSDQSIATPPEDHISHFVPFQGEDDGIAFPSYMPTDEFNENLLTTFGQQQPMVDDIDLDMALGGTTPSSTSSGHFDPYMNNPHFTIEEDIYSAHARLPTPVWHTDVKLMAGFQPYQQMPVGAHHTSGVSASPTLVLHDTHISPIGAGNTMLFTPNSLAEVDEGFDDFPADCGNGSDFQLFPSSNNDVYKNQQFDSLFNEVPSSGLGFSQSTTQDMLNSANLDWSHMNMDFQNYQEWDPRENRLPNQ